MNIFGSRPALLALVLVAVGTAACKSSTSDHDLGTVMAGTYSVHLIQEGDFAASTTVKYAVQPSPGKPDKVECWFGTETSTPHVTATYDPNDNDFDCLIPIPAGTVTTDEVWFTLTTGTTTANGSIAPAR